MKKCLDSISKEEVLEQKKDFLIASKELFKHESLNFDPLLEDLVDSIFDFIYKIIKEKEDFLDLELYKSTLSLDEDPLIKDVSKYIKDIRVSTDAILEKILGYTSEDSKNQEFLKKLGGEYNYIEFLSTEDFVPKSGVDYLMRVDGIVGGVRADLSIVFGYIKDGLEFGNKKYFEGELGKISFEQNENKEKLRLTSEQEKIINIDGYNYIEGIKLLKVDKLGEEILAYIRNIRHVYIKLGKSTDSEEKARLVKGIYSQMHGLFRNAFLGQKANSMIIMEDPYEESGYFDAMGDTNAERMEGFLLLFYQFMKTTYYTRFFK